MERREAELRAKREEEERKRLEEALCARQEEERKRLEEEELARRKQVRREEKICSEHYLSSNTMLYIKKMCYHTEEREFLLLAHVCCTSTHCTFLSWKLFLMYLSH